jgi:MFS family permease
MAQRGFFYGWVIVGVLMVTTALGAGSRFVFGVVLKPMTEEFSWERSTLAAVVSVSLVLASIIQVVVGWLADRVSPRWLITVGLGLSTIVLFGMSQVHSLWQVYALYAVIGSIGFALVSPVVSTAIVNRWFHSRQRGLALSLTTSGAAVGQLIIPPLAAYGLGMGGWRLPYSVLAAFLLLVALPLILILLRDAPADTPSASAFLQATPPTPLAQAMRDSTFWKLMLGVFACGFTMSFASVHFIAHADDIGLESHMAADALGLSGLFSILGAVLIGRWSDRIGRRIPLGVTYSLRALSFVVLFLTTSNWMMFLFGVILGLSWTATTPLSAAITAETWGQRSSGFLFGIIFPFMHVGSAVGAFAAGLNHDILHNYGLAIIINATIAGLAAIASFAIREHDAPAPSVELRVASDATPAGR